MLPAQYRMRRSADFGATVKHGRRAVQPDLILYDRVIHDRRTDPSEESAVRDAAATSPRVGLIIAKSVGNAVDRHRVARRLRHVAREVLTDLEPREQLVIRALPSSNGATSDELGTQLRTGLRSIRRAAGAVR
ncbi:ribonuclease P protein component [Mycolicibacter heraklionensis]|uniref:ribonuclease P protein component n=1 Tax=Mycolicibacter heraklionensis TaxID=512402 RepID=UPI00061AF3FE|nr:MULTISPECIES: ribonuclease P protein component [Mycobacteriaceae]OBG39881.1 ribonuclease P protein component [Mycolicibacter heraklionensis]OBJ34647.1 ribonuclease P protein component [Mycolicibacter heraklionensis]